MANPNEDRLRDIAARGGQEQYEFDKFKAMTGRSDTNPYGDAGMFGSRADYSRTMSPRQIDQINRMAFEQARGLTSGEGYQGRGMDSPQPGYAPALKIGENIPGGTVQRATPRGTGLGSFFKDGGFLGAFLSDIGGRAPRRFAANAPAAAFLPDGDALGAVDYDIRAARPALRPYNAAEMLQNNMPIANPVIETGGSFGVAPMEAIANPGGQAYEAPVAGMADMTLPPPSPAEVTRENLMDAILADQVRDRNAQIIENLVTRAAADSQMRQAAAPSVVDDVVDYDTMPYFESSRSPFADPIAAAARSNPNATEYRTAPAISPASTLYETNFGIMSAEDIANMTPMERSQLSFIDDVQFVYDELAAGRRGLPTIR